MKLLHKLTMATLLSACALGSFANSAENEMVSEDSAIYKIVTQAIHESVAQVEYELDLQVQKSILTVSNEISFDEAPIPTNKITITDLIAKTESSKKETDNSEKSNLTE